MSKKALLLVGLFILACGSSILVNSPATRTPLPTLTPTPLFDRWQATEVIRAIKAAGLESENAHLMAPEEYEPIPALAAQGIRFAIPSACPNCSGVVLSFNDRAAMESTRTFYTEITAETNPALSSWIFEKDNVLLQLSGELPESRALQYGSVLVRLNR